VRPLLQDNLYRTKHIRSRVVDYAGNCLSAVLCWRCGVCVKLQGSIAEA
jgi:hypothetical protein